MCARRTFDPANTHRQVDLCPPPVPKALDHCLPLCESRGCPWGLRWFRSRSPITQVLKTGARTVHLNKLAVGKILAKRAKSHEWGPLPLTYGYQRMCLPCALTALPMCAFLPISTRAIWVNPDSSINTRDCYFRLVFSSFLGGALWGDWGFF
jgi:hypothetical protein